MTRLVNIDRLESSDLDTHAKADSKPLKIALVSAPWSSVTLPSLALGILKQVASNLGHSVDVFYLNMLLAKHVGFSLYEAFAVLPVAPEWFFLPSLHFSNQPIDIGRSRQHILERLQTSELRDLVRQASQFSESPMERCATIASDLIPQFIIECCQVSNWSQYDVVGFTTTFSQNIASITLANAFKRQAPNINIVLGGANVDGEMGVELLQAFPSIDYIVHGEAERTFPLLLDRIAGLSSHDSLNDPKIPGVSYRTHHETLAISTDGSSLPVDIEYSPIPDHSDYVRDLQVYGHRDKLQLRLYFESSRGCWWGAKHHCTFCGLNGATMAYRHKTADKVLSDILEMSRRYKCLSFFACDNILAREYFSSLLPRLAATGFDFDLFYEVKANLTKQQISLLAEAGVRDIQPGIESLNTRLLRLMDKGVTALQNIQLLKWCQEMSVVPLWNLLYGFPGEHTDDYRDYPRLFHLISHMHPPSGFIRVLFERYSPYHFDREKYGLNLVPSKIYNLLYAGTSVDQAKIAYYFEGIYGETDNYDPEATVKELIAMVEEWKLKSERRQVYCTYTRGDEFILITDTRNEGSRKQFLLDGHLAALYLFCDEIRGMKSIIHFIEDRSDGKVGERGVRKWLSQLIDAGLVLEEDGRYLSLAVKSHEASNRK